MGEAQRVDGRNPVTYSAAIGNGGVACGATYAVAAASHSQHTLSQRALHTLYTIPTSCMAVSPSITHISWTAGPGGEQPRIPCPMPYTHPHDPCPTRLPRARLPIPPRTVY